VKLSSVLAILVAALSLGGTGCGGGGSEPSEASATEEWAAGFCTALTTWTDTLEQVGDELTSSTSVEGVEEAAADVKSATETLVDDLRGLGGPDTESGEDIQQALDDLGTALDEDLAELEDAVEDVTSLTDLPGAASAIASAFQSMNEAFSSMLETLENADVRGELEDAFAQSDSCAEFSP